MSKDYLHRITTDYFTCGINTNPTAYSFSINSLDSFTEKLISFEPVYDGHVTNLNHLCDIKIHIKEANYDIYSDTMIDQYIEVVRCAKETRRKIINYLNENFGASLFLS